MEEMEPPIRSSSNECRIHKRRLLLGAALLVGMEPEPELERLRRRRRTAETFLRRCDNGLRELDGRVGERGMRGGEGRNWRCAGRRRGRGIEKGSTRVYCREKSSQQRRGREQRIQEAALDTLAQPLSLALTSPPIIFFFAEK